MAGISTFKCACFQPPSSSISYSSNKLLLPQLRISPRRSTTFPRIYALTSNDIKVGLNIEVDGNPWKVIEFLHVKPGKGAAFVRTTLRNYVSGNQVEKTFRAGSKPFYEEKLGLEYKEHDTSILFLHIESPEYIVVSLKFDNRIDDSERQLQELEEADISKQTKQYTYKDGAQYVFMDLNTYEEYRLNAADVGDKTKWLKEGMDCNLLFWNGKVIDFELPITVKLTVVEVDPGLRGDTAQGGSKPATLDTGAVVNVPLFIDIGQEIMVDTRTGQYMSRA